MLGATFIPEAKGFDLVDGMQNSCVMLPAELLADLRQRRRCELFDDVYGDLAGEGDSFGVGAHFQILFAEAEVARTRTYRQILLTKRIWEQETEDRVELFQVDDEGLLYISPAITDWNTLNRYKVDTVIDHDSGLDDGVPTAPNHLRYIYFPILDEDLPNLTKLHALADLGAALVRRDYCVLSHCGMGFNRYGLMAGLILNQLGMFSSEAVKRLRERRPGAFFNQCFASYLQSL